MIAHFLELIGLRSISFESWSEQVEDDLEGLLGCRILESEEELDSLFADGMTPKEAVDYILEKEGVDLEAIGR